MLLSKRQIEHLILNYHIGNLISCKKLKRGVSNHNWLVETKEGKFVLRIASEPDGFNGVLFELRYLDYLRKKGFSYEIPLPIPNSNGEMISSFSGYPFWVYRFIEGSGLEPWRKNELKQVAEMMASYHQIIEASGLNNNSKFGDSFHIDWLLEELTRFKKRAAKEKRKTKKEIVFLAEVDELIDLAKNLEAKGYSKLKKFPIHCDLEPENILFRNGKLVGVLDFENVSYRNETIIRDITTTLQYSCRTEDSVHMLDLDKAKYFLKQYRNHHSLANSEIEFIPDLATSECIDAFYYNYYLLEHDPKRGKIRRLTLYSKSAKWYSHTKERIVSTLIF